MLDFLLKIVYLVFMLDISIYSTKERGIPKGRPCPKIKPTLNNHFNNFVRPDLKIARKYLYHNKYISYDSYEDIISVN
jgi:hypothetical protein